MTTHQPAVETGSPLLPRWALMLWFLAMIAGGGAALIMTATPSRSTTGTRVVYRDHAVERHAGDALAVRSACDEQGIYRRYRSRSPKDPNKFYEICRLPDGRLGLRIVRAACRVAETGQVVLEEVTSFIPGYEGAKGTWKFTKSYVHKRATLFRWPLNSRMANLQLGVCK